MKDTAVIWENHTINKVELSKEKAIDLFNGVISCTLDERVHELVNLQDGYYFIEEVNQYFEIQTKEVQQFNEKWKEVVFPWGKPSVIHDYLDKLHLRDYQEAEGEILAEMTVFNNDIDNELVFVDGVAKMKNYYRKTVEVHSHGDGWFDLYVNGIDEVNICPNPDEGEYSAYDGVDGYGWYDTVKKAVKGYMDYKYRYINPLDGNEDDCYDVSCSNCGDGGCFYCEPHRFL